MHFEIHEAMSLVPNREPGRRAAAVPPNPLDEIAGYADIQCAVAIVGDDVDRWLFHVHACRSEDKGAGFPLSRE